jgi:hypothetical protein
MAFVDREQFLSSKELEACKSLIIDHGFKPKDFQIDVIEDQDAMSMEDLEYIVMLYITIVHLPSQSTQTYNCAQNSGLWIKELAEDLENGLFGTRH